MVLNVQPGSSAEVAGLRGSKLDRRGNIIPGDIIIAIDQTPVDSVHALLSRLDRHRAGDEVDVRIWRSGRELVIPIVLTAGR